MKKHKKIYFIFCILIILLIGINYKKNSYIKTNKTVVERKDENMKLEPRAGGEIIIPLIGLNTLNPLKVENASYYYLSQLIYDSLFDYDENLNTVPELVEHYKVENQGKSIYIKLREDVFWHDGNKLTSKDIDFTIDTIKYGDNIYRQVILNEIEKAGSRNIGKALNIKILDEYNIKIIFDKMYSNNLEMLTFPIIPEHIYSIGESKNNYAKALSTKDFKPIGTGAYKVESCENMKELSFVANDKYREGRPYIDKIISKVLDNEEDVLTAFESGQINMATSTNIDWDKYSENNRINIIEYVSNNYEFLGFNFERDIFKGEQGKILRKAIAYGIDRQEIVRNVYLGHATQVDVPIHPNSWLNWEKGNVYGYNLDLARSLINELEWKDLDGNGILESKEGKEKIRLKLLTNTYNEARLQSVEIIKNNLKKIGIDVEIYPETRKIGEFISAEQISNQLEEINKIINKRNYDMILAGWKLSTIPELNSMFHSNQISRNNIIKYSSKEMDKLLDNTLLTKTREEKLKLYKEVQSLIVDDLPYMSMFFKNKSLLLDSKIIGEFNPTFINPYKGIEKAYIIEEID